MNRRRLAIVLVSLAVVGPLTGLLWLESRLRTRQSQRPEVGTVFPALPGLANGELLPVSPDRLRVVTFAKAGCGNCDRTITTLRRLAVEDTFGFDLIAVIAGSDTAEPGANGVHRFITDRDSAVSRSFGVVHVPLVFLVDRNSRVRAVTTGERPEAAWRSFLEIETDAL